MAKNTTSQNHDASCSWSDLAHDVLSLIMMKVGVVDFLAFIRVCNSWRLLALSNKKKFIESKPPMSISICSRVFRKDRCYLEDSDGRKIKRSLRHSVGRTFVGLTCGYVILYGRKTRDFWLVNPITRHELHFPGFPFCLDDAQQRIRAILVFSPSMSEWVFIAGEIHKKQIWFSITGKATWNDFTSTYSMRDLHAFKGKIYIITSFNDVCELRLNPQPQVTLLKTKKTPDVHMFKSIVRVGEKLFVIGYGKRNEYIVLELDTGEMKWVQPKNTMGYAFEKQCENRPPNAIYDYLYDKSRKYKLYQTWYNTHECMSVDIIHD